MTYALLLWHSFVTSGSFLGSIVYQTTSALMVSEPARLAVLGLGLLAAAYGMQKKSRNMPQP